MIIGPDIDDSCIFLLEHDRRCFSNLKCVSMTYESIKPIFILNFSLIFVNILLYNYNNINNYITFNSFMSVVSVFSSLA